MKEKIIILGYGFVAKNLLPFLVENGYEVFTTSRKPDKYPDKKITYFDLNNTETYKNIPENSIIIWTFPAEPFSVVQDFYYFLKSAKNTDINIILGTSFSYLKKEGLVDETERLDSSQERVKSENFLKEKGSVVLQLSGIYGGEKHPFNWLNKGLIKNGNKNVNLIHINDICRIIFFILGGNFKGERFNLTDGRKYFWRDIWSAGNEKDLVKVNAPPLLAKEERIISNQKVQKLLGCDYRFESLLTD